jgi:tripartite ATP-independent transporter DctM subunit
MDILIIITFVVLFILGFPVVIAITLPSIVYVLVMGFPFEMVSQRMMYALDSFPLVAVPVFILVGNLMNSAGISRRIFAFASTTVGRFPGGLAQVNIFASLIFSGISGAALADIGGLGKIEIAAMRERGFTKEFSGAVTAASAIVGPIFPPSIPLIIYGSITSVSIVKLLIGGILPAIVCVLLLMLVTTFVALKRDLPRSEKWPTFKEIIHDFWPALPALIAPAFLVFGMLSGYFTPTEAGSVTVVYVLVISSTFYRELTWKHVVSAFADTIRNTASILLILSASALFGWILAVEGLPQAVSKAFLTIGSETWVLLILVNIILLVAGMFLDSTTATLLIIPIIAGPVVMSGVDPVHLGIIAIFNLMCGLITPPMGYSLFLVSKMADTTIGGLLKALAPYYLPLIITLGLITFIPSISLWLPRMLK